MKFGRTHVVLGLALGFLAGGQGVRSVFADEAHHHDAIEVEKEISDALAKLALEDRKQAEAQRFCPMMEYGRLGSMGAPIKLAIDGKPVFLCCKNCVTKAQANPDPTLAKVDALVKAGMSDEHGDHDHAKHKEGAK